MSTTEHLEKIKAKCLANLTISEKRTQGKWQAWGDNIGRGVSPLGIDDTELKRDDAAYIAACAGAAEAGWKSTIAAIDQLLTMKRDTLIWAFVSKPMQDAIIAAWPEKLL